MSTLQRYAQMNYRVITLSAHAGTAHVTLPQHGIKLPRRDIMRPRRNRWGAMREVFRIGLELLFVTWTVSVLAFWLALIAGMVL